MTNETTYSHICVMLREYDLHTGNRAADGVISNPEKWIDSEYFPFYASAAALLIETRAKLDTKTTPRAAVTAITRIYKNCNASRPEMCGLFTYEDRFVTLNEQNQKMHKASLKQRMAADKDRRAS